MHRCAYGDPNHEALDAYNGHMLPFIGGLSSRVRHGREID